MTPNGARGKGASADSRLTRATGLILSYNLTRTGGVNEPRGCGGQAARGESVHADRQARRGDDRDFDRRRRTRIIVRGRDLAAELMGAASFTEFFFLLATGRMPTEEQRFFLDLAWSRSPNTA